MLILLFGESNSGKSTLGTGLSKILGIDYISSGDIARRISDADILNNGGMAPESAMRNEIMNVLNNSGTGLILDGFPRFEDQFNWLCQYVDCKDILGFRIVAPYDELLRRSQARGRDDDVSFEKKHKYYIDNVIPMIYNIKSKIDIITIENYKIDINDNIRLMLREVMRHMNRRVIC